MYDETPEAQDQDEAQANPSPSPPSPFSPSLSHALLNALDVEAAKASLGEPTGEQLSIPGLGVPVYRGCVVLHQDGETCFASWNRGTVTIRAEGLSIGEALRELADMVDIAELNSSV